LAGIMPQITKETKMDEYTESGMAYPVSNGWSITVKELKLALESVPDDYEVMLSCTNEVEDMDICTVHIDRMYPPSITGSVGLFILNGGQGVNSEYDYDNRMDAHLELGGSPHWNDRTQTWNSI
jgi:hypothetical protein